MVHKQMHHDIKGNLKKKKKKKKSYRFKSKYKTRNFLKITGKILQDLDFSEEFSNMKTEA